MASILHIHPTHPQMRLVEKAVDILRNGGVIAYPTDSAYALGCRLGDKEALERIRRIRHLDQNHNFTLMCRDLSEISLYARVNNPLFRLLKANTPGPYTFIMPASKEVPRRLLHPRRKTIGLRVPDNLIALEILGTLNESILSVTLILPGNELPLADCEEIADRLGSQIDLIVDGGSCGVEPTTVVDLTSGVPEILREGKGDIVSIVR